MRIALRRLSTGDDGTVGEIVADGRRVCFTLELPWRDNASGVSCIPPGNYDVRYLARSTSGKYHDVYHVSGVPGRGGILIHGGNFAGDRTLGMRSDVLGCVLPGRRLGRLATPRGLQLAVIDSRAALRDLHVVTGRNSFTLTVTGEIPCSTHFSALAAAS